MSKFSNTKTKIPNKSLIIFFILILNDDLFGQTYNLEELYILSTLSNIEIRQLDVLSMIKKEKIMQAKAELLPQISLNSTYGINDDIVTHSKGINTNNTSSVSNTQSSTSSSSNTTSSSNSTSSLSNSGSNSSGGSNSTSTSNSIFFNTEIEETDNNTISLNANWTIWDKTKWTKRKLAKENYNISKFDKSNRQHEIAQQISKTYFELSYLQEILSNFQEELESLKLIFSAVQTEYNLGAIPKRDVINVEIEQSKIEINISKTYSSIFQKLKLLYEITGIKLDDYRLLQLKINKLNFPKLSNIETYLTNFEKNNQVLKILHNKIFLSELEISMAKSSRLPKITSSFQYNLRTSSTRETSTSVSSTSSSSSTTGSSTETSNSNTSSTESNSTQTSPNSTSTNSSTNSSSSSSSTSSTESIGTNISENSNITDGEKYRFMINLSLPLYTGGRSSSLIKEAALRHKNQSYTLGKRRYELRLLLNQLWKSAKNDASKISVYEKAIDLNTEISKTDIENYNIGIISKKELLENSRELFKLKNEYLGSIYEYLYKLIELDFLSTNNTINLISTFNQIIEHE